MPVSETTTRTDPKTAVMRFRVPTDVRDAIEFEAAELGLKPGSLLRRLLETRYSLRVDVRKFHSAARKKRDEVDFDD